MGSQPNPEDGPRFLLVRAGGHRCAVPVAAAKLVTKAVRPVALPGSASRLLGLAQIDGEPVAVVDLHALLDPDGGPAGGHQLTVVVRRPDGAVTLGLAVSEVFGVIVVEESRPPAKMDPPWVSGRSQWDGRDLVILDPAKLFGDTETVRERNL